MASIGRRMISVGTLLGAIGLVRIQLLIRRAHAAHPREMGDMLARLGYSEKSVESSLMIVGSVRRSSASVPGNERHFPRTRENRAATVVRSYVCRRGVGGSGHRHGNTGS